jgi:hypothetical protein
VNELHPRADGVVAHFTLADAQLVTARSLRARQNWTSSAREK